jgi:hypothetical protein
MHIGSGPGPDLTLSVSRRTISSMTGPVPDISGYPTKNDDVYEWLLSDYWAAAERRRRAEDRYTEDTHRAAQIDGVFRVPDQPQE